MATTDGQIAIDGEIHDVPADGIVHIHPAVERNLCNRTADEAHVWLAIGAPPVGTIEDVGSSGVSDEE